MVSMTLKSHHETIAVWVNNEIYNFNVETEDEYTMIEKVVNYYIATANTIDI